MEDLAYLAFWAYNTTVLLHLLRGDEGIREACEASEELDVLDNFAELIHSIHGEPRAFRKGKSLSLSVFIIRATERRVDAMLDAALLDYEPLEDFDDLRFEGDWNLFKSITGRSNKRSTAMKASDIFANGSSTSSGASDVGLPASPSLFGSLRENVVNGSPFKSMLSQPSISDLNDSATTRSQSADSSMTISAATGVFSGDNEIKPQRITEILSAVLMILNLYEVNPAVTIQAFSQIFYWIFSELFNRILVRKKYLCRSKAMQIKMNITVLEDWIRNNGLPIRIVTQHLEPLSQLLQWLQCCSQIRHFDTLIGTLQSLKALNPLQMRRAVRDYRFEVNEGKMTEECAQYLAQLQKDWEKRRVQLGVAAEQAKASGQKATSSPASARHGAHIDTLFDGTQAMMDFVPQGGPECLGEMFESRYMLPFQLPTNNACLVATPPANASFARTTMTLGVHDAPKGSRPSSRGSFASGSPMGWSLPDEDVLRRLPPNFFRWLKERKAQLRREEDAFRVHRPSPARSHPLHAIIHGDIAPTKSMFHQNEPLPPVAEDEITPVLPASASYPAGKLFKPPPTLRSSQSLEALRQSAKTTFSPTPIDRHQRSESFELQDRLSSGPLSVQYRGNAQPQSAPLPGDAMLETTPSHPSRKRVDSTSSGRKWWQIGSPSATSDRQNPMQDFDTRHNEGTNGGYVWGMGG